jgi:hypothetical protein
VVDRISKDKAKDWELENPLYNFYKLNPVDMSYHFSYDTGQESFFTKFFYPKTSSKKQISQYLLSLMK